KEGHTFLGWYQESDFSGSPVNVLEIPIFEDINLYAKWMINTFEVTFVTNSKNTLEKVTVDYGNKIQRPALYQVGYRLIAWYIDEEFETMWDFNVDVVKTNLTLYAKWELVTFTITYHYDGGILPDDQENPTTYTIESETIV